MTSKAPHDDTADCDPRWLDDDEMAAWLALLGLLGRLPPALDRQLRRDADLTPFEYQMLVGLSDSPCHAARMSDLAPVTDGSLPRLSQAAARLEKRGFITRQQDPQDGRATLATLTDAGMAKLREAAPGHVEHVRQLVFDPLTRTQVDQLRDICLRIGQAVEDRCC